MKGRAGAYSFYSSKGRQVVRVSQNSTNYGESARRSPAQQSRRVRWANLVNFYKACQSFMKGAFESKKANETDYNAFMRKNLPLARIFLEKEEAAVSACIVDQYFVSEGSLPTITKDVDGVELVTAIAATGTITANTLVSDFTDMLLANNNWLSEGMQISLIIANQSVIGGVPRVAVQKMELTLSRSNTHTLGAYFPGIAYNVDDDSHLSIEHGAGSGAGLTMILSDSTSGRIKVSTEHIWPLDNSLIAEYSSQGQLEQAMESYGVDPTYFLESGSDPINPDVPAQKVLSALVNNSFVKNGGTLTFAEGVGLTSLRINFALDLEDIDSVNLYAGGDSVTIGAIDWSLDFNTLILAASGLETFVEEFGANVIPFKAVVTIGESTYAIEWTVVRS